MSHPFYSLTLILPVRKNPRQKFSTPFYFPLVRLLGQFAPKGQMAPTKILLTH